MATRTVSHDRGDHIEIVVYSDGLEISRATKPKKQKPKKPPQLGDTIESFLTSHGVTKEWYIEFKKEHGLPPTCNCDARQEWLNETSGAHPTIANIGVKLLAALTRKKP
jgi:hypothetical protein